MVVFLFLFNSPPIPKKLPQYKNTAFYKYTLYVCHQCVYYLSHLPLTRKVEDLAFFQVKLICMDYL